MTHSNSHGDIGMSDRNMAISVWNIPYIQDSLDHCPMPINVDQCRSKSWHWSEMSLNADHCLIWHWSALIGIDRHWDQCQNFERHWSTLGIDWGNPDHNRWSTGWSTKNTNLFWQQWSNIGSYNFYQEWGVCFLMVRGQNFLRWSEGGEKGGNFGGTKFFSQKVNKGGRIFRLV